MRKIYTILFVTAMFTACSNSDDTDDSQTLPNVEYVTVTYNGQTTKWAKMNIGATTVAESPATAYGDYYAWGELDTYYSSVSYSAYNAATVNFTKSSADAHISGLKTGYDWANYCNNNDTITEWSPAPYDATSMLLTTDYDVAHKKLGGTWRMPTPKECLNLYAACGQPDTSLYCVPTKCYASKDITSQGIYWITYQAEGIKIGSTTYKVPGMLFVPDASKLDEVVFFPGTGYMEFSELYYVGTYASCWASRLYTPDTSKAYRLFMRPSIIGPQLFNTRNKGFTVRAVSD